MLAPPLNDSVSVRRSIDALPLSPSTVRVVPTSVVLTEVIRPLESTVITGISVEDPVVPAVTPVSVSSTLARAPSPVPSMTAIPLPPTAWSSRT
jgi:hypothetical protein